MPGNNRNRRLRELIAGGLHQASLDTLSREFAALAQDTSEVLPFFVLHHDCRRLSAALEGEAVSLPRFHELTGGLAGQMTAILAALDAGQPVAADLEKLVASLFENLALFRS